MKWYAVALLLSPLFKLVAAGLNILSGAKLPNNIHWIAQSDLLFSIIMAVFIISIGEEPGFRGFALPRFLNRYTALAASLIVGVLHAIWHIPLFITGDDSPITTTIVIISGSILFTWLFNKTNGSVLIAMLLHTSVDVWKDIFQPVFVGADAQRLETWYVALFIAMAVLLPILTGKELGRKPEAAMAPMAAEQTSMAS